MGRKWFMMYQYYTFIINIFNILFSLCLHIVQIFVLHYTHIVYQTTLIISKKPGNTGISRDIRTEFTTDLLLSD